MSKTRLPFENIKNLAIAAFFLGFALGIIFSSLIVEKILVPPVIILLLLIIALGLGISSYMFLSNKS